MVKTTALAPVPKPLVAATTTVKVPARVGVPEITPVPVFTNKPGGRADAEKVLGLALAVIVKEKAIPTVPKVVVALVTVGSATAAAGVRLPPLDTDAVL